MSHGEPRARFSFPRPRLRGDRAGARQTAATGGMHTTQATSTHALPCGQSPSASHAWPLGAEVLVFVADRHTVDGLRAVAVGAAGDPVGALSGARLGAEAAAME